MTTQPAEDLRDAALYAEAALAVKLCASLDSVAAEIRLDRAAREAAEIRRAEEPPWWPVPLPPIYQTGTVTVDRAADQRPMDGYVWDVRWLRVSTFTTGTVSAYLTSSAGDQNLFLKWPNPGLYTFEHGGGIIKPDERLVWVFSGVDNATTSGRVWNIREDRLPDYLMGGR